MTLLRKKYDLETVSLSQTLFHPFLHTFRLPLGIKLGLFHSVVSKIFVPRKFVSFKFFTIPVGNLLECIDTYSDK